MLPPDMQEASGYDDRQDLARGKKKNKTLGAMSAWPVEVQERHGRVKNQSCSPEELSRTASRRLPQCVPHFAHLLTPGVTSAMHVIDLDTWRNSREAETGAESKDIPMTSSRSTVHGPTHIPTDGAVGACGAEAVASYCKAFAVAPTGTLPPSNPGPSQRRPLLLLSSCDEPYQTSLRNSRLTS
jgi:hypothetical protein